LAIAPHVSPATLPVNRMQNSAMVLASLAISLGGCFLQSQNTAERPIDATQERLLQISQAYRQFNTQTNRPPKSAVELQPIFKRLGAGQDVLISPRDNESFEIFWGVNLSVPPSWAKSRPILAHEKHGKDGSRYVLTTLRRVELLTDEQFAASSFPPGHEPPK